MKARDRRHWQLRHMLLFEALYNESPFGLTRPQLRSIFDMHFPQFSGYSFAGAMASLVNAGLVEVCEGDDCPWYWAASAAVEAWNMRGQLIGEIPS